MRPSADPRGASCILFGCFRGLAIALPEVLAEAMKRYQCGVDLCFTVTDQLNTDHLKTRTSNAAVVLL